MQVYTQWGTDKVATVAESTHVRYQGGVKSDVLRALDAGEKVEVLETMENWTKIKTDDCFIGYVENGKLKDYADEKPSLNPPFSSVYVCSKMLPKQIVSSCLFIAFNISKI